MMSSPFPGPPKMSFDTANGAAPVPPPYTDDQLDTELAKLNPAAQVLSQPPAHARR